jgi:hypothetical protein
MSDNTIAFPSTLNSNELLQLDLSNIATSLLNYFEEITVNQNYIIYSDNTREITITYKTGHNFRILFDEQKFELYKDNLKIINETRTNILTLYEFHEMFSIIKFYI